MTGLRAGLSAFRQGFLTSDVEELGDFTSYDARRARYDLFWAMVENTTYQNIHSWAQKYRTDYALYKHIRSIYAPATRLIDFHTWHLLGGALDPDAGDGQAVPSAIPIVTDRLPLRPALAAVWKASNWNFRKDLYTRYGCTNGDVGLEVVDDIGRQRVYIKVVHPGLIASVDRDPWGNIKGYVRQETRQNPANARAQNVTYTERVTRDGVDVVYQTYLDDKPYDWTGRGVTWREPYGFVPLVMCQHIDVGLDWGWGELHPGLSKMREADELASNLHDRIGIVNNAPWLITGMQPPRAGTGVTTTGSDPTTNRPQPGRDELNVLYSTNAESKATPLVAPIDIAATGEQINALLKELERDYPELQMDIWTASGDASGRALRVARQRVETKVKQRRAGYDDGLVRAQAMAVAIGGMRGYRGYDGFSLDSYGAGDLDHRIGDRPVFAEDETERDDERTAFWTAIGLATKAGVPLAVALADAGWDETRLAKLAAATAVPPDDAAMPPQTGA